MITSKWNGRVHRGVLGHAIWCTVIEKFPTFQFLLFCSRYSLPPPPPPPVFQNQPSVFIKIFGRPFFVLRLLSQERGVVSHMSNVSWSGGLVVSLSPAHSQ